MDFPNLVTQRVGLAVQSNNRLNVPRGGRRTGNGIMVYRGVAPILPYAWSSERVDGAGLDGGGVLVSTRTLLWGSAPRLYEVAFGVGRYGRRGFAGVNVKIWRGDHVARGFHRV